MWKMKRYLVVIVVSLLYGLFAYYTLYVMGSTGSMHRHSHSSAFSGWGAERDRTPLWATSAGGENLTRGSTRTAGSNDDKASHPNLRVDGTSKETGRGSISRQGPAWDSPGGGSSTGSSEHERGKDGIGGGGGGDSGGDDGGGGGDGSGHSKPLLRILVLTYKRAKSLQRCLDSLNAAEYDGQPTVVEIHVDRSKDVKVHNDTLNVARTFAFRHGRVQVFVRPRHGGVLGQWLSSWKVPQDNASEIAVFLEDDLTVSPYFSRWLRLVHEKYDGYPGINGYALQAETIRHAIGTDSRLMEGPPGENAFLYPILGSWGFSPNTDCWREFLRWYQHASQDAKFLPLVPGLKPSQWYQDFYKTGRTETMWTMWHIYHATHNHEYTLYSHFANRKGLAFNWKEPGEHYSKTEMAKGLKAHLLDFWDLSDVRLPDTLVIMDAKGKVTGRKLSHSGLV